jgi:hypothetical protein
MCQIQKPLSRKFVTAVTASFVAVPLVPFHYAEQCRVDHLLSSHLDRRFRGTTTFQMALEYRQQAEEVELRRRKDGIIDESAMDRERMHQVVAAVEHAMELFVGLSDGRKQSTTSLSGIGKAGAATQAGDWEHHCWMVAV